MSSAYVRTNIKAFLASEATDETVIDLTSDFQEIKELMREHDVQPDAPWLGVQFIGDDEVPVALAATNDQGKYRETGAIYIHVVSIAKIGVGDAMLTRGEVLRNLFRGRRIGNIVIESVSPMNFDNGATLAFEGGYMSGSFIMAYHMDLDL
jgi:hypothetical protein